MAHEQKESHRALAGAKCIDGAIEKRKRSELYDYFIGVLVIAPIFFLPLMLIDTDHLPEIVKDWGEVWHHTFSLLAIYQIVNITSEGAYYFTERGITEQVQVPEMMLWKEVRSYQVLLQKEEIIFVLKNGETYTVKLELSRQMPDKKKIEAFLVERI